MYVPNNNYRPGFAFPRLKGFLSAVLIGSLIANYLFVVGTLRGVEEEAEHGYKVSSFSALDDAADVYRPRNH